jgi:hypothetical protein
MTSEALRHFLKLRCVSALIIFGGYTGYLVTTLKRLTHSVTKDLFWLVTRVTNRAFCNPCNQLRRASGYRVAQYFQRCNQVTAVTTQNDNVRNVAQLASVPAGASDGA